MVDSLAQAFSLRGVTAKELTATPRMTREPIKHFAHIAQGIASERQVIEKYSIGAFSSIARV